MYILVPSGLSHSPLAWVEKHIVWFCASFVKGHTGVFRHHVHRFQHGVFHIDWANTVGNFYKYTRKLPPKPRRTPNIGPLIHYTTNLNRGGSQTPHGPFRWRLARRHQRRSCQTTMKLWSDAAIHKHMSSVRKRNPLLQYTGCINKK